MDNMINVIDIISNLNCIYLNYLFLLIYCLLRLIVWLIKKNCFNNEFLWVWGCELVKWGKKGFEGNSNIEKVI